MIRTKREWNIPFHSAHERKLSINKLKKKKKLCPQNFSLKKLDNEYLLTIKIELLRFQINRGSESEVKCINIVLII